MQKCSAQLSSMASALRKVMVITLTTSPVLFPSSHTASQELLLSFTEGSFLMCDFYWEPLSCMMVLTPRPVSSLYITAALLSFFGQTYCHLPTSQRVITLQNTKQTQKCLKPNTQFHSKTPPKSHLIIMGIIGIPVTWFWHCPPLLQALCNLHSWREEVECRQAGAATSSQPPPCLALVSSLICSIATWSLPPEPGLTAGKPVTVFFTTLNEIL